MFIIRKDIYVINYYITIRRKVSILSAEVALRSQDDKKRINEVKEKINGEELNEE